MNQIDPIELHRQNVARMRDPIVVIPGYPGAGAALLGNIFLELALNYFDPYTQVLQTDGSTNPVVERVDYRARLAASFHQDRNASRAQPTSTLYCKTHLFPSDFRAAALSSAVLLTRDPRDAIYSYYQWRLSFSEEGESGTFAEFLQRGGRAGRSPVKDWLDFHCAWLEAGECHYMLSVVRFEDLKAAAAHQTIGDLLKILGVTRSDQEIDRAIKASSFMRMRKHEDAIADRDLQRDRGARIMRRGKVNEWQEWYAPEHRPYFEIAGLASLARRFGYEL